MLRAAGWHLSGWLPQSPLDAAPDLPRYGDLQELLEDSRLDAVALDAEGSGSDGGLGSDLPLLRRAGLLVLLTSPAPLSPAELLPALAAPEAPEVAVAFALRQQPWARTVAAALPLAGGPPLQVTVRDWPAGRRAAAELVDVVADWCGEVVSVSGAPEALPVRALPDGRPVAWSLLTSCGATVLVSLAAGAVPPRLRLSLPGARLRAGPTGVRWEDGADLPPLRVPGLPPDGPAAEAPGLWVAALGLLRSRAGGALDAQPEPHARGLGALLAAARAVEALEESTRTGAPVLTA